MLSILTYFQECMPSNGQCMFRVDVSFIFGCSPQDPFPAGAVDAMSLTEKQADHLLAHWVDNVPELVRLSIARPVHVHVHVPHCPLAAVGAQSSVTFSNTALDCFDTEFVFLGGFSTNQNPQIALNMTSFATRSVFGTTIHGVFDGFEGKPGRQFEEIYVAQHVYTVFIGQEAILIGRSRCYDKIPDGSESLALYDMLSFHLFIANFCRYGGPWGRKTPLIVEIHPSHALTPGEAPKHLARAKLRATIPCQSPTRC
jgi:hypothetical protein